MKPNDLLAEFMTAHDVRSEHRDDWVVFPDHGKRGYAHSFPRPGACKLDVSIDIFPGWTLMESFAGVGDDEDEALVNGFEGFARSSLHVILSAFFSHSHDDQVSREQWIIAGTPRQITLGNVVFRGHTPAQAVNWFPQFEKGLTSSDLSEGTHWLRLYYAQQNNAPMAHEALLDNEPWPEMQKAMTRFAWPAANQFYSQRLFLVIQGGVGLAEACATLTRKSGADAIAEMIAMGATPRRAALLSALVPLAFGRQLIEGMGGVISADAVFCGPDGEEVLRPLAGEPIFREAAALAKSRCQLSKDQFAAIALQSPEISAVNDALNRGSTPGDLILSPPVILLPA